MSALPLLNLGMLFGVFAFNIPIVIHLFNKSRYKVVPWGAMHLLENVIRKNKKRVRMEQIILLIVRCLIPTLLALCMARPVFRRWDNVVDWVFVPAGAGLVLLLSYFVASWLRWSLVALAGLAAVYVALVSAGVMGSLFKSASPVDTYFGGKDQSTSMVLIVDDSYSMEAGGAQSNYKVGVEDGVKVLDGLPQGSIAQVLMMGGGVRPLLGEASMNLNRVAEALKSSRSGFGAADVYGALEQAAKDIGEMKNSKREVVVISDFQKSDWGGLDAAGRARAVEMLRQKHENVKPSLTLFQVGKAARDNVAVESVEVSRSVIGVGQTFKVTANVKNFGDVDYGVGTSAGAAGNLEVTAHLKVDGAERTAPQSQPLIARGSVQFTFPDVVIDKEGSHVIEVSVEADALLADNAMMAAVGVWDRVPVLLVSGDRGREALRGETDFLEIALRPYTSGRSTTADLLTTKTIDPKEVTQELMKEHRVVVLANVRSLSDAQAEQLESYVREGGSVIIFPGDRVDVNWYNSKLFAGGSGLLPAKLAALSGSLQEQDKQVAILTQHFDHPSLQFFNDPGNGNLSDGKIMLWYRLEPAAGGTEAGSVVVTAKLSNGDPFMVEKRVGEGLVLEAAIPADADWSNLPVRRFYLPVMQQVMTYAASKVYPPRNVEVGRPLTAFFKNALAGTTAVMTDPEGKEHSVDVVDRGSRAVAEYRDTLRPGLYVLKTSDGKEMHFVAYVSRKESDIVVLTDAEMKTLAQSMGASYVTSLEAYRDLDKTRRFGLEVWFYLFVLVMVLIACELVLQQVFAKRGV